MRKKNVSNPLVVVLLVVTGMLAAMLGITWAGNDYRLRQQSVTIEGPAGELAGVLTLPKKSHPGGLVVMVHGDGAVNASQDGLYGPWFEGAADAGYATLSWSKPGVDGSAGNWLDQTMEDRAAEVSAVIDWAQREDEIPAQRIVLWGASQAGWVVPKVTRQRNDIDAVVGVGPAVNWLRQSRFNLDAQLEHEQAGDQKRQRCLAQSDQTRRLLERGVDYSVYRAETSDPEPMSEDRWNFVSMNFTADAEEDLEASATRALPIHLMVGTHDRNVDVEETEDTYRKIFGPELSVAHFDAVHSLARPVMEDNDTVGWLTAVVWPRALLAPDVIDDYTSFLTELSQ